MKSTNAPSVVTHYFKKAVDAKALSLVQLLIDEGGADPNVPKPGLSTPPPLLIAASMGLLEVVKALLARGADVSVTFGKTHETVLHCILKKGQGQANSYHEILLHLLQNEKTRRKLLCVINMRDKLDNTALHYATQKWDQATVRLLLECGANIGMKNHWEEVPISKISPDTMEAFLDEFCIEARGDVNHENFELTFDYSFLAPPKEDIPFVNRGKLIEPECQAFSATEDEETEKNPITRDALSMAHVSVQKP